MKFLLFDCDGVLVDTEAIAAKVVTQWLNQCNCNISSDQFIKEHTGKTFGNIFKELVETGLLLNEYWKDETIRDLENEIYSNIKVVDSITQCLEELKGYEKAVISNSRESMVKKALSTTGLNQFFESNRIFSSEKVKLPKPDPGIYMLALKNLKLGKEECVAIEDSISGVRAASQAGIFTIGFAGASHQPEGHDKQLIEAGASQIAYHALEIPELIKGI